MDNFSNAINTLFNSFVSVIKTFGIKDILDIALVSYLVYKGVKLVRETRAEQLVKGIILLILSFFIVNLFGLKTMSYVMENLFQIGIFAIIVVFQPELRRALEKFGRAKVSTLNVFTSSPDEMEKQINTLENSVKIIVKSIECLSSKKTGALIVFERRTRLGEQIETGVEINAKPSIELIHNIFFHNSPLHDGAMIIRDGQILAAACFLPKPQSEEFIDRQLGARHRAAIGMSENSDAIIVIVSEETGSISLAENGRLKRHLSLSQLNLILTKKIIPERHEENKEKKSKFWRFKK